MKKLLVVALVLAMASVASATLTLEPASLSASVDDGVKVDSDVAQTDAFGDFVYVLCTSAVGTLSDGKDLTGGGFSSITATSDATYGAGYMMSGAAFPGTIPAGTWFTMDFAIGTTAGNITMYGSDTGGNLDATNVIDTIVVPEPMTIALLGLGGLFLRRRK